jgi:hypothetical protein
MNPYKVTKIFRKMVGLGEMGSQSREKSSLKEMGAEWLSGEMDG